MFQYHLQSLSHPLPILALVLSKVAFLREVVVHELPHLKSGLMIFTAGFGDYDCITNSLIMYETKEVVVPEVQMQAAVSA